MCHFYSKGVLERAFFTAGTSMHAQISPTPLSSNIKTTILPASSPRHPRTQSTSKKQSKMAGNLDV